MKKQFGFLSSILAIGFMASNVFAAAPNFANLSSNDFNSVMNDFSALSSYSSVSGASGRGSIFGFEVGIVGSLTSTPNANTVAQKTDPTISIPSLPNAGILAAISIPMGLSFEVIFLPKNTFNGLSFQKVGAAVQYKLLDLPISIATKLHYTTTKFDFSEVLNGVNTTVSFDDSIYGIDLMAGKDLIFIEPYVGLGYATANANLGVSGTVSSIFAPSFTAAQSANATPSSARVLVGVNFKLLLINLGVEYLRTFGTESYNFKLSAGF